VRKEAGALVGAALLLAGPSLAADPPRVTTTFKFEVKFRDGAQTYNENLGLTANVWLPADQGWQCNRPPLLPVEGRVRGAFACSNDGWKTDVLTMIGCKTSEGDSTRTAAMRLYSPRPDGQPQGSPVPDAGTGGGQNPLYGKWVDLTVSCETVATR
jgi:hypothetical protein